MKTALPIAPSQKKHIVSEGIYFDGQRYSYRPKNARTGRRTEKRLKARTLRLAILEHAKLLSAPIEKLALERLAELYIAADCPTRKGEERESTFDHAAESKRINSLAKYFGKFPAHEIRLKHCREYKIWRCRRITRENATGHRTVDMDLTTLSNLLHFGVEEGHLEFNPIHAGRGRYQTKSRIVSCRDRAPVSGDELHRLAFYFLDHKQRDTQTLGWQLLFEALTGCRTSEILRFRIDAADERTAGFTGGQYLYLERSKKGVNPYALIHPDLQECLSAHRQWHHEKFSESPWYFPASIRQGKVPVSPTALTKALKRAAEFMGIPHRTSHGLRSYYVTVRRSQGIRDAQIAAEIGDKSGASIIEQTYGAIPENWTGGDHLTFRPKEAAPAWAKWLPTNIIPLQSASGR